MKEIYRNKKCKNTAKITFKSKGRTVSVYFQLNDNPVQHTWQNKQTEKLQFYTYPMTNVGLENIVKKLNELVEIVKEEKISYPPSQDQLNYLHSKFVEEKSKNEKAWQMINLLIHNLEHAKNDPFIDYNCSVYFIREPEDNFVPIKEEYKLWLTTEHRWGDLILGYGTLGKDWLEIFKGNDHIDELAIQSTVSTETCMFFHVENPYKKFDEKEFYPWAKINNVNLDSLNNLSLGKYILGQIIITEEFLSYNPNISDWYVPNHICKLNWNKEFIGPDTEVISIDFFDSDMYYESLMQHSKLSTIYV